MTQTPYKQRNRTGENFKKKLKFRDQEDSIDLVSTPDNIGTNDHVDQQLPEIAAQYEVLELIGKGGMGAVYKVFDKHLGKVLAVKLMQQDLAKDQIAQKRFEQEVEATCQLTHENLIATYGHGTTTDGTPYLVMEYVPGEALSDLLIREGPLEASRALQLWHQICEALEHAHKNGVIHRDLKPTNVIISRASDGTETARLLDFGIAKIISATSRETHNLTETGTVFGSPQYMSPEHCLGFKMDERSDIYSLGCLVYEMLTGRTPFSDSNAVQVVVKHINEEALPFSAEQKLDRLGKKLEGVTLKCLEKDSDRRYQSVSEIIKDLTLISQGKQPSKFIRHKKPRAEFSRRQILASVAGASLVIMAIWQYSGMFDPHWQRLLISSSIFIVCATGSIAFLFAAIDQMKQIVSGNGSSRVWWQAALSISLTISCWAYLNNAVLLLSNWSPLQSLFAVMHAPKWLEAAASWLPFINKVAFGSAVISGLGCLVFHRTKRITFFEFAFQHAVFTYLILVLVCGTMPKQTSSMLNLITGGVIEERAPALNENLLRLSLLLDPRNQRSVINLADAYVKRGDRAQADVVYENYFIREPLKNEVAWARYKHALSYQNEIDSQLKFQELTQAIRLAPRREYYEARGVINWNRGLYKDALWDFFGATRCEPSAIGPYCKRALVFGAVYDWNSALGELNRIASSQATNQHPEIYFLRGLIYEKLGDPEAIKDFQRVIALSATEDQYDGFYDSDKLIRLAYCYKKTGDIANYERTFEELVKSPDYKLATEKLKTDLKRAHLGLEWKRSSTAGGD
jgi:serine/threonine protein kinase